MQLFYSRKMEKRGRMPIALAFCFVGLYLYLGVSPNGKSGSSRDLVLVFVLGLLCLLFRNFYYFGGGTPVFALDPWGSLCLLPGRDFNGRKGEVMSLIQERFRKNGCLPQNAVAIQQVLSVRSLGNFYWIRCFVQGKAFAKNLIVDDSYENLTQLLQELENRM